MAKPVRGKVKRKLWVRSICTDTSSSYSDGQEARRNFEQDCRGDEEGGADVVSADVLDEAFELSELQVPAGDSEARKPPYFVR